MKKMILKAAAVVAITITAFAFKPFGDGAVYCASTCAATSKIDFRVDPSGPFTNVCGLDPVTHNPLPIYQWNSNSNCITVTAGSNFQSTSTGQ